MCLRGRYKKNPVSIFFMWVKAFVETIDVGETYTLIYHFSLISISIGVGVVAYQRLVTHYLPKRLILKANFPNFLFTRCVCVQESLKQLLTC